MKIEASKRLQAAKSPGAEFTKAAETYNAICTNLEDIQSEVNSLLDSMNDADAFESADAAQLKKIMAALKDLKPAVTNAKGAIKEASKAWKKVSSLMD